MTVPDWLYKLLADPPDSKSYWEQTEEAIGGAVEESKARNRQAEAASAAEHQAALEADTPLLATEEAATAIAADELRVLTGDDADLTLVPLGAREARDVAIQTAVKEALAKELTESLAAGEYADYQNKLKECGMTIAPTGLDDYDDWWGEKGCEIWNLCDEVANTQREGGCLIEEFNTCAAENGGETFPAVKSLFNEGKTLETCEKLASLGEESAGVTGFFAQVRDESETTPTECDDKLQAVESHLKKIARLWAEQDKIAETAVGLAATDTDGSVSDALCKAAEEAAAEHVAQGGATGPNPCTQARTFLADKATIYSREGAILGGPDSQAQRVLGDVYKDVIVAGYKKMVFKEQCFLLAKIFDLSFYKKNILEMVDPQTKKLPYYAEENPDDNASLMVGGESYGFINRLTQHPAQDAFFNMKTEEISSLQPMIRLFKVVEMEPSKESKCFGLGAGEAEQEFLFDAYASKGDVESLFQDTHKRGFGVGIKNFSFTYDGHDPFSAKKSIRARLQLFASSFDELLKERPGTNPDIDDPYMYADLALKTWTKKSKESTGDGTSDAAISQKCAELEAIKEENKNKLTFKLKAVIGWARPPGNTDLFTSMSENAEASVIDAINESYVTLTLTPTTHEFDIDEMGRVNFTINYLAYVDDFFDQPQFDIFYDEENGVAVRQKAREYALKILQKEKCGDGVDKLKELWADSGIVRRDKFLNTQSIIKRLTTAGVFCETNIAKVKYIELSAEELRTFQTKGPFFERGKGVEVTDNPANSFAVGKDIAQVYEAATLSTADSSNAKSAFEKAQAKANLKFALEVSNPEKETIAFFYVSDLLDVVLQSISERLRAFERDETWQAVEQEMRAMNVSQLTASLSKLKAYKEREIKKNKAFYRQFAKFRLVMGPLEILNPRNNKREKKLGEPPSDHVSFGDVPISVKYFMEWMTEKTTKKDQMEYYLSKFINDFFNDLLRNFLNSDNCFSYSTKQKIRLNKAAITSYKECETRYDEITSWILDYSKKHNLNPRISRADLDLMKQDRAPCPALNISGPCATPRPLPTSHGPPTNEINYLVYFAGRTQPRELMNGSRSQDAQNGIFHYMIGRPRGIVKTINLSRTDATGLKEVRFEQEGFDGLEQLREVYDVNVDSYANVKTFPGTYIYVDPRGFAPNTTSYNGGITDLTKFGIGGYCMIIRSEHEFGPGQANTKITAKWVAQIENEAEAAECAAAQNESQAGDGGSKPRCATE